MHKNVTFAGSIKYCVKKDLKLHLILLRVHLYHWKCKATVYILHKYSKTSMVVCNSQPVFNCTANNQDIFKQYLIKNGRSQFTYYAYYILQE